MVEGGSPQTEGVLRVMNMLGQLIEERKQVEPGQLIQLGHDYINGMYLIEYTQGADRAILKVNKRPLALVSDPLFKLVIYKFI